MRSTHSRLAAGAAATLAITTTALGMTISGASAATKPAAKPQHIFFIMMENHGYNQIIGNTEDAPYINYLAATYNAETNFHGVTHPSLPNYLSMFSGSYQGIFDDCKAGPGTCAPEEFVPDSGDDTDKVSLTPAETQNASNTPHLFTGKNLVDQLEANGLTWKAYMQSMPTGNATGVEYAPTESDGTLVKLYAQKHNPFFYFSDIVNNPARVADVVPFENNFAGDLSSGHVPNFVWISPDQCHDMHGISPTGASEIGVPECGYPDSGLDHGAIRLGDRFLDDTINEIMSSSTWKTSSSSIVVSWDENDYSGYSGGPGSPVGANGAILGGGDAPMIVINNSGPGHKTDKQLADHYSVLSTIENLWHLGCLANTCSAKTSGNVDTLFH